MIDKEEIIRIAKAKDLLNREFIEKDYYIDLILYRISKANVKAVFKGGTALYKIYKVPRFSEDLDFAPLESIEAIEEKVGNIAKSLRFDMEAKKFGTSFFAKLSFKGFLTQRNRIKLEFNNLFKPLHYHVETYISDYIDIPPFMISVMDKREILAEKIHAIYHRLSARDLYDLFYLLRTERPDFELIREKVPEFNHESFEERLSEYERVWDKEIKLFALEYVSFEVVKRYVSEKMKS